MKSRIRKCILSSVENYNLVSAGVVDKADKLVGMITGDDVFTVLKEEAEEDAGSSDFVPGGSAKVVLVERSCILVPSPITAFITVSGGACT